MSRSIHSIKPHQHGYQVTPRQLYELQELINSIKEEGSPARSSDDSQVVEKGLLSARNKPKPVRPKNHEFHAKIENYHAPTSVKAFTIRRTNIFVDNDKTPRSKASNGKTADHSPKSVENESSVIIHDDAEDSEFKGVSQPSSFRLKKIVIPNRNIEKSPEIKSPRSKILTQNGDRSPTNEATTSPTRSKFSPKAKNGFHYDPFKPERVILVDYGQSPHSPAVLLENKPVRPSNSKAEVSPRERRVIQPEKLILFK